LHDAISAEKAGKPAAAIMTDRFTTTARLMAEVCGLPDYPFAVVAHPISSDDDAGLRSKAEVVVRRCAEILTRR
jgi:hypothetical protein